MHYALLMSYPPACPFPIQNNAMKIKSCQKACAAVPKEADCSTLFAPLLSYRRNRSISSSFSPPPPYRNYGACLSLFLGRLVVAQKQKRSKMRRGRERERQWPYFLALFPLSVSASSVLSSGLWICGLIPQNPPSLLSFLSSPLR